MVHDPRMDRRALLGLTAVVATAVSATSAKAAGGGGGGSSGQAYTRLPTLTANVRRSNGRGAIMTVETGVEALIPGYAEKIAQRKPRLSAAYATVVRQVASETLPNTPPDVERLVRLLCAETERVLEGRGGRVLLGTVMVI